MSDPCEFCGWTDKGCPPGGCVTFGDLPSGKSGDVLGNGEWVQPKPSLWAKEWAATAAATGMTREELAEAAIDHGRKQERAAIVAMGRRRVAILSQWAVEKSDAGYAGASEWEARRAALNLFIDNVEAGDHITSKDR